MQTPSVPLSSSSTGGSVDLLRMVGHRENVQANETLQAVHKRFAQRQFGFMAVLDGVRLLGLCSRQQIGMILGARFGFAIHSGKPIREHLLGETTRVGINEPISRVLTASTKHSTLIKTNSESRGF